MNNLLSILGLACMNESFRAKLLNEGRGVESELPVLLTMGEKTLLDRLVNSAAKRASLMEAFSAVRLAAEVDCETPPYCPWSDKVFTTRERLS